MAADDDIGNRIVGGDLERSPPFDGEPVFIGSFADRDGIEIAEAAVVEDDAR